MTTFERIAGRLKELGKEQKDLTDFLGVSQQLYSEWKAGRSTSYKQRIDKIAEYLNVTTDYLLGSDEIKKRPTPEEAGRLAEYMKSEEFRRFSELFMKLTPDEQKKVREHAELIERARSHKDE
jgi:Predicted transcriptional regulator with C-terminal CBS domains